MPAMGALTWDALIGFEPELAFLELQTRNAKGADDEVEQFFARVVKARMKELVGWLRKKDGPYAEDVERVLRSQDAYVVALAYLYDALPNNY